jgi:hypothetical protein
MRLDTNSTLHWFGFDQSGLDVSDRRVYYCPSAAAYPPYYFRVYPLLGHKIAVLGLKIPYANAIADKHVTRVLRLSVLQVRRRLLRRSAA